MGPAKVSPVGLPARSARHGCRRAGRAWVVLLLVVALAAIAGASSARAATVAPPGSDPGWFAHLSEAQKQALINHYYNGTGNQPPYTQNGILSSEMKPATPRYTEALDGWESQVRPQNGISSNVTRNYNTARMALRQASGTLPDWETIASRAGPIASRLSLYFGTFALGFTIGTALNEGIFHIGIDDPWPPADPVSFSERRVVYKSQSQGIGGFGWTTTLADAGYPQGGWVLQRQKVGTDMLDTWIEGESPSCFWSATEPPSLGAFDRLTASVNYVCNTTATAAAYVAAPEQVGADLPVNDPAIDSTGYPNIDPASPEPGAVRSALGSLLDGPGRFSRLRRSDDCVLSSVAAGLTTCGGTADPRGAPSDTDSPDTTPSPAPEDAPPPPQTATLPDCDGLTFIGCRDLLQQAGLLGTIRSTTRTRQTAILPKPAGKVTDTVPAVGSIVALDDDIDVFVNPDPMPFAVPAVQGRVKRATYVQTLHDAGATNVRVQTLTDATTDTAVGPDEVSAVEPQPGERVFPDEEVVVRVNPETAPVPQEGGIGTCGPTVPPIDLSPLRHDVGGKFPFGIFAWLLGALGGWTGGGEAPRIVIPIHGDELVVDFAQLEPAMEVVRPVILVLSLLSLGWLFASSALGFGSSSGTED